MDNSHDWHDVAHAVLQGLLETAVLLAIFVLGGVAATVIRIFE